MQPFLISIVVGKFLNVFNCSLLFETILGESFAVSFFDKLPDFFFENIQFCETLTRIVGKKSIDW